MDIIGILVLVISFFFLLVVGVPVAYSIGVAGILTMLVNIDSLPALTTYAMRMASGLDSFALLAIPFFILAGNIMNNGGIAIRLVNCAKILSGRMPGAWQRPMWWPTCCSEPSAVPAWRQPRLSAEPSGRWRKKRAIQRIIWRL